MTRFVVVYDRGAASPMEVGSGLGPLGEVVFAVPPSPFNERLAPLLGQFGRVVPIGRESAVDDVRRLRPDAVLTFSESRLRLTAEITSGLGLPGHLPETARALTDKYLQRDRLRAAGVDRIRSVRLDGRSWTDAVAEVGLPAVLKPARGEGSRETHRVDEATPHPAAGPGMVLEEYLTGRDTGPYGDYVSVESLVSAGWITHLAVTGKHPLLPPFRERGDFWPARLEDLERDRLHILTGRALDALGITTGITHTEIKLTADGPRIIEVNGRPAGYLNGFSTRAAGVDIVRLAGRAALGGPVVPPPIAVEGVHFQYFNPAPTFACRLRSVTGAAELRALPGITAYRRLVHPGTEIEASVMTSCLDVIQGTAPDHEAMLALLARAQRTLTFTFDTPSGPLTLHGTDLVELSRRPRP